MSLPIRTFLDRTLPWSQAGAYFNVHWFTGSKKVRGRAFTSLDSMVKHIEWLKKQSDVRDIYVCMSSQLTCEKKIAANGYEMMWADRSIKGAVELKSIWIDVDVKANSYTSTKEAGIALAKFLVDSKMPRPTMIVATGSGGFHCHWVLDTPVKPDVWKVLASALAAAAKHHGFMIDAGVTTDAARILRVPDTLNYKHNPPRPAVLGSQVRTTDYTVAELTLVLQPYMVATPPPLVTPGVTNNVFKLVNDDLTGGIGTQFVFDEFKSAIEFLEAQAPNPFRLGVYDGIRDLMFACVYVEITYPNDAVATRELFELVSTRAGRKLEDRLKDYDNNLRTMPAKIAANETVLTHATIFKMARDLGWAPPRPQTVQPGTPDPDLPPGYTREIDGTIWVTKVDKEGLSHQVQVAPYPMEKAWISNEPLTLNFITKIRKKTPTISIQSEKAAQKMHVGPILAAQGFVIKPVSAGDVQEFLLAWITHLQNTRRSSNAHAFGWTGGGFAYSGVIHGLSGVVPAGSCDPMVARQYQPCGDLQHWIDCAKIVTDEGRPAMDAILASAFAGPLVKLLGQDGLLICAHSPESGIGKSTALRIAQAVWGHPIEAAQVLTDTYNASVGKLGEIRNLPMYWDEIKSEEQTQKFVDLAFQLSSGRDKARMTQSAVLRKSGTWETLILSCSNDSIVDSIASVTKQSTAGVYRCFEFRVPPATVKSSRSPATVMVAVSELKDHFGRAGQLYAGYLGSNQIAIAKRVKELNENLFNMTKALQEERYWIASIAALLSGAIYANDLGLTNIDIFKLRDFLLRQLTSLRMSPSLSGVSMVHTPNVADVLTRFLRDMRARNTLFTNVIHRRPGRAVPGAVKILRPNPALDKLKVHIGLDDRLMRVGMADLGDWLRDNKYSTQTFYEEFRKHFGMTEHVTSLGTGTEASTGQMRCLEFVLNNPQMQGFFDTI